MSIRYIATVLDRIPGLTHVETLILVALADYASDETRECWPSIASIQRRSRCDRRTVQRRLRELEKRGLIECARGGHQYGKGAASCYRLMFDHDGNRLEGPAAAKLSPGKKSPRAAERRGGAAERRPKGGTAPPQGRQSAAPSIIGSVMDPKSATQNAAEEKKPRPRRSATRQLPGAETVDISAERDRQLAELKARSRPAPAPLELEQERDGVAP